MKHSLLAITWLSLCCHNLSAEQNKPVAMKQIFFRASDKFLQGQTNHIELVRIEGREALRLERKSDSQPAADDLILDFEHESLFSNPANQNLLVESKVERRKTPAMSGNAGHFLSAGKGIKLNLPPRINFSGMGLTRESGDFSFSAEILSADAEGEILRRENFIDGTHYLFIIALRKGRVIVELTNLLEYKGAAGRRMTQSVTLKSPDKIGRTGTVAHHLLLTYEEGNGRLNLSVDGKPQADFTLSRRSDENTTLTFATLARAPLKLFPNFRGIADNIILTNRVLTTEDFSHFGKLKPYGDRYDERRGTLLSEVFDMRYSQSQIIELKADIETNPENGAVLKARCLNQRFVRTLSENDFGFKKAAAFLNTRCRFLQFRLEMVANNAGTESPLLHGLVLEYVENPPPAAPLPPRILRTANESLEIGLVPNTEMDVIKGGRYIIYYGHKPHEPQGAIYFTGSEKSIGHKVPLKVRVDYETIAANKSWADKRPRFKNRYPVFEAGLGFYFWVTACDSAWSDAQEFADHESTPSPAVFARFD